MIRADMCYMIVNAVNPIRNIRMRWGIIGVKQQVFLQAVRKRVASALYAVDVMQPVRKNCLQQGTTGAKPEVLIQPVRKRATPTMYVTTVTAAKLVLMRLRRWGTSFLPLTNIAETV